MVKNHYEAWLHRWPRYMYIKAAFHGLGRHAELASLTRKELLGLHGKTFCPRAMLAMISETLIVRAPTLAALTLRWCMEVNAHG